jgi:signal transduction histidine kinase
MDPDRSSWRLRLLFPAMALAILAIVVARHPASDPIWLALVLAAPGGLPFVAEAVRPRLAGSPRLFAAGLVGALATVVLLAVHRSAYAELAPFLLVLLAARVGLVLPPGASLLVMLLLAGTPLALDVTAGTHIPLAVAVGTACSWLAGVGMRTQDRLLRELRAAQAGVADRAAAGERRRITREIHDLVAHSLSVAMLHLTGARLSLADGDAAEAMDALGEAERTGRDAMREIRQAIGLPSGAGATATLPRAADLPELVAGYRSAGLRVALEVVGDLDGLSGDTGLCLYRVAQESLANAARHAPDGAVRVVLRVVGGAVRLTVDNELRRPSTASASGLGIPGMAERVALLGGTFAAGPRDAGWRVAVALPVTAE